jgi:hypothetical protein
MTRTRARRWTGAARHPEGKVDCGPVRLAPPAHCEQAVGRLLPPGSGGLPATLSVRSSARLRPHLQQSGEGERSAGVQSSTCLLLAAHREIPTFNAAVVADTGWEPRAVYRHLHRLTRIAERPGIPALNVLGNGVIPQQAAVALRLLLCPHRWAMR